MIPTAAGLGLGAVVAALLWAGGQDMFASGFLARTNYRAAEVVTAVGVLVPVTMVVVAAGVVVLTRATGDFPVWDQAVVPALGAALGFGLLGLFDDVAGVGQSGGFRGHLRAAGEGRITSGVVKLVGGAALGIVAASSISPGAGWAGILRDGASVALAANLANLLDRAPGRVVKVTGATFVLTAALARNPTLFGPGVGIGAGLGLLPVDLGERAMLGDAGANPLGAMCAIAALIATPSTAGRWLLVVVLTGLNLLSEVVSFSAIIDRMPPLRWLDRVGSRRPR